MTATTILTIKIKKSNLHLLVFQRTSPLKKKKKKVTIIIIVVERYVSFFFFFCKLNFPSLL